MTGQTSNSSVISVPSVAMALSSFLQTLPGCKRFLIAYSGGMDSHVLLHLLAGLRFDTDCEIKALHVNHNIQHESPAWARHCQETCDALDVELEVIDVDASQSGRESPESWARQLRYDAFERLLAEDDILLTAHHQDDQLETFLLRLFRGSGVMGLASMRAVRKLGKGLHARPLLEHSRAELFEYAARNNLDWVEDPSNADQRIDRNFVRHEVIPAIKKRWPSVVLPVTRTIRINADTQLLLDEVTREDLSTCATEKTDILVVDRLKRLSIPRQKNVLRYWSRVLNLPAPGSRHLSHIISDVIQAKHDATARVGWKGAELYRYGNHIYLTAPMGRFDNSAIRSWDFIRPCQLQYGELTAVEGQGDGLKKELCVNAAVEVRYRTGGEEIRLPGRTCRHKIKKLFQETRVPPWLRERIPFIYIDNQLAMVAGLWTDAGFLAADNEDAWIISWNRAADLIFLK